MDVALTMVEHHVWLVGELIDRAERHEHDHAPGGAPDGGDELLRTLLNVLVGQQEMWLDTVDGKPGSDDSDHTLADLRLRHADVGQRFLELARTVVAEGRATERFREGTADHPDVFTYGGLIAHLLTFGAHLRAQVLSLLTEADRSDLRHGDPLVFFAQRASEE